jgi:DNA primase
MPTVDEVYKEISNTMKIGKVEKYGPEDLPAGPELKSAEDAIIVEGRADIINLMRCGILNAVALEGAKVPESIKKLTKEKECTALLDGDRGGDLILKELLQVTNVRFVGRAPRGKEIEECNCKEIMDALAAKVAVNSISKPKKVRPKTALPEAIRHGVKALQGTLEAVLLNEKLEQIKRLPVSQLAEKLQQVKKVVDTIIFDGIITQRIVDLAAEKNIKRIVAARKSEAVKPALNVELITFQEAAQK